MFQINQEGIVLMNRNLELRLQTDFIRFSFLISSSYILFTRIRESYYRLLRRL